MRPLQDAPVHAIQRYRAGLLFTQASIVFSIAPTLGWTSLEMTQRAPGCVMLSRSARLNCATGKSLPFARRANDRISMNASRCGLVLSWSKIRRSEADKDLMALLRNKSQAAVNSRKCSFREVATF